MIDMGSEIECPSCNGKNNVRTHCDRSLRSLIVTFDRTPSRRYLRCRDCGNRFQVIALAR